MLNASQSWNTYGSAWLKSSGMASRWALYSSYLWCRCVGSGVSKTTAICVGSPFSMMESKVLAKAKTADVFMPFEVMRGLRIIAKWPR